MKYRGYHRVFGLMLGIAVITNLALHIVTQIEADSVHRNESQIAFGFQALEELSEAKTALNHFIAAVARGDQLAQNDFKGQLQEHFRNLERMSTADSKLSANIQALTPLQLADDRQLEQNFMLLDQALASSRALQKQALDAYLQNDINSTGYSQKRIVVISTFGFFLIVMCAIIWWHFDRVRGQHEMSLMTSIQGFECSNQQLQLILEKKSRELRSTVHDLKNPLGSIKCFSELIQEKSDDTKSVTQMTQAIQRLSDHSLTLVNSLLDLEASSASVVTVDRPFNVVSYIEDVCYVLKPQAQVKQQRVECVHDAARLEVIADPKKIWDVFMNLISNAIKFSPPRGEIIVRISNSETDVIIEIEDQGPGFTTEDKCKAFGRFAVLSAKPTGGESSSGLGLNIVDRTLKDYGGTIKILDAQNHPGALVRVSLPMSVA